MGCITTYGILQGPPPIPATPEEMPATLSDNGAVAIKSYSPPSQANPRPTQRQWCRRWFSVLLN